MNRSLVAAAAAVSLTAMASGAWAGTIYQDSFARTGPLDGSTPDVVTTNGNTWTGQGWWTPYPSVNGGYVASNTTDCGGGSLPVNGTSGANLDGSQSFTLSADVWTTTSSDEVHLYLGSLAELSLQGNTGQVYQRGTWIDTVTGTFASSSSQPVNLELAYDAGAKTIAFEMNGAMVGSQYIQNPMSVTASDIQALSTVGFYFYNTGDNTAGLTNFTLSTVPEPAALSLLTATAGGLLMRRRKA